MRTTHILLLFVSSLMALVPAGYSADPTDSPQASFSEGLVARWTFDTSDSAKTVPNAVEPAFNAQAASEVERAEGVYGQAGKLFGANSIAVPGNVIPGDLTAVSFTAWVSPVVDSGRAKPDRYYEIVRKEDNDLRLLFSFQEHMQVLSLGLNAGGNYLECDAAIAPEEVLDGCWHFVAASFDGKIQRVYLDGTEIGSQDHAGELKTAVPSTNKATPISEWGIDPKVYDKNTSKDTVQAENQPNPVPVKVDHAPVFLGSSSGNGEFFQGRLDDVRIYSVALNADRVAEMYRDGLKQLGETSSESTAIQSAMSFYKKCATLTETLVQIKQRAIEMNQELDAATIVQLQRLVRNDFRDEYRQFIKKARLNPITFLTMTDDALMAQAKNLAQRYVEYMPVTEMQWSVLSDDDRQKWENVKQIRDSFEKQINSIAAGETATGKTAEGETATGKTDTCALLEIVLSMSSSIDDRPYEHEAVAPYRAPHTPAIVPVEDPTVQQTLEAEWLFQCDNQPTLARTNQEITWTRQLAARILADPKLTDEAKQKIDFSLKALEVLALRAKYRPQNEQNAALYCAVRQLKRDIHFCTPAIDFDSVLFVDRPFPEGSEWAHETRHFLGYLSTPGGRLMTLKGLSPAGKLTQIMPQAPLHGTFWRPDLSFDAKKIVFSYMPHNEKAFHLYEINLDGTGLRQLTGGIFDDFDPVYMPDGQHIMFLTTRGHLYVRCMPPTNAMVMARMSLDDDKVYIISRNGEPEYTPSVLNDGRVIYTRWEYTDKPLWRCQSLWTMNADGTQVQTFWGNQSVWPDLLKDARAIPGSERIMFTGSAHHNWFTGSIGIIDPRQGFNFPDGLTKVTADISWPESGNGPVDPIESKDYHRLGGYRSYYSPYPLSEKDFLVCAERNGQFVLLLMDTDGNRDLIHKGTYNIFYPIPIRARTVPPTAPDQVEWPTWEERANPKPGVIYSNNVYDGAPEALKGKAKYLRILSIEHKTYTMWNQRPYASSGPETSMVQSEGVKRVLGTVPIEPDGSVSFTAPAGVALHFQLLDEHHRALQTMRSFTGVMPGEYRGCLGCHESQVRTPVRNMTGAALRREPSRIQPYPWEDNSVGYERYVQPVLDKYCGKCHQDPGSDAYKAINLTLRPGYGSFKEPYVTLLGRPTWGQAYTKPAVEPPGFGWADTIMVEAFDQRDPVAYSTFAPMTKLSYRSRLVERMASGTHHDVKVDPESLLRVILWVDTMGPYKGAEEVRAIDDPQFQGVDWISIRPRIKTAPIVQRPGPFDAFHTDDAYDAPEECEINRLPPGM